MEAGLTQDITMNKLIMLFIFDKMENAMTEKTLLDMCTYENNWISHTNCMEILSMLVENNFIYRSVPKSQHKKVLYDLTTEGRICLHNFYARIPSSYRQKIATAIRSARIEYRRRQDYVANYEKCPDGSYDVTLRIDEPPKTALTIVINVPTRKQAKQLDQSWEAKAPLAYAKLHELLIDG